MSDDALEVDELATQRARREIARIFSDNGIPGELSGELFFFAFGGLVARVEIMKNESTAAHAHMTLSAPDFATPVLDCWSGIGKNHAAAVESAIVQWAKGPYWAYHDAFAHNDHPTYEIQYGEASFQVFEAPLQWYRTGADAGEPDSALALAATGTLLKSAQLPRLSPLRAHRLRWVRGLNDLVEVMLDDEPQPALCAELVGLPWPEPAALMYRHSAVLLPKAMADKRQRNNLSLEDAHAALTKASGLTEAGAEHVLLAALQHGIERDPMNDRIPELCSRWSRLEALRSRETNIVRPLDATMSRGLLIAYANMVSGRPGEALDWLRESLARVSGLPALAGRHVRSMAESFGEFALPGRTDAIVNVARQIVGEGSGIQGTAEVSSSSLEAPSAVAAVREALSTANVVISYAEIHPIRASDPRKPFVEHGTRLWSYAAKGLFGRMVGRLETDARPAAPAPRAEVVAKVLGIAGSPYSRVKWSNAAEGLFREHDIEDLLHVMVHPPRVEGLTPWDSRFHVMVAAAFGIGRLVAPPFSLSPGAVTLLRLLDGQVDWTTTAAALALLDVALRIPECEREVINELAERLTREISPIWYLCYVEPALWLLLRLPGVEGELEEVLVERLTQ